MQRFKAILVFGAPGIGKGTQAKLLAQNNLNFLHFSTGEMCRRLKTDEKMKNTEIAKKVEAIISKGNLISDDLLVELLFKTLDNYVKEGKFNPEKQIIILDGSPRTVKQTELIKERIDVIKIIYFTFSSEDILAKRLQKRAIIEGRSDDSDRNTIKNRLNIYRKETAAVLNQYPKKIILEIDGMPPIQEVYRNMISKLKI